MSRSSRSFGLRVRPGRPALTSLRFVSPALCLALWAGLAAGCRHSRETAAPAAETRFEFTQPHMGVPFRLVVYALNRDRAEDAARAAFQRVRQLNDLLSDYDTDSELNRLSRTSGRNEWVPVSDELWRVLQQAQSMARRSGGAFDVTVGPCASLWRRARRLKQFPEAERLARARAAAGYDKVRLDPVGQRVKLVAPDMKLDLGGIAKGYAVDQALKVLRRHGIRRALVAGAGDLAAGDPPPGQRGWRVEVAPLDVSNAPPAQFVRLADAGLATSGDAFQFVELEGRRYSHIVDPRTGRGLTDHSRVTVIAPDCATADSLATAVSVLGPREGLRLVEATRGAAAFIVRQPGAALEQVESRRFRRFREPAPGG